MESKWSSDSGEKFQQDILNFSPLPTPKFSFCFKFQPQKTEKMRTRPQGEERGRRGAALGSDVWTEEEELWCRSAAQIRLSHKSLELPRDGQPTACLSVCLDKLTLKRKSKKSSEGVKPKQQEEQKSEKVEALEQEES